MKRDSCAGLEWQCKSRKASLCNASNRRKCSANPKLKQVHCRFPQKLQCKSQIKAGALSLSPESAVQITNQSKCTAKVRRKCSTEPGNKQVHCTCKPEVQYRTRKISKCTARASRKCITDPRNQATAMHYPAQSLTHATSTASRHQRSSPPRTR